MQLTFRHFIASAKK